MAIIKRQLQLLLPSLSIFLDVDDLQDIGELESYIGQSAVVLLFLSRGYFQVRAHTTSRAHHHVANPTRNLSRAQSKNCLREIRSSAEKHKPAALVHECDTDRGGEPLDVLRATCPADAAEYVGFDRREVIEWHRIFDLQLVSLKRIAAIVMRACAASALKSNRVSGRAAAAAGDAGALEEATTSLRETAVFETLQSLEHRVEDAAETVEHAVANAAGAVADGVVSKMSAALGQGEDAFYKRISVDDLVVDGELSSQPLRVPRPLVLWASDANPGAKAAALALCSGIVAAAARKTAAEGIASAMHTVEEAAVGASHTLGGRLRRYLHVFDGHGGDKTVAQVPPSRSATSTGSPTPVASSPKGQRREIKATLTSAVPPVIASARQHTATREQTLGSAASSRHFLRSASFEARLVSSTSDDAPSPETGARATHMLLYLNEKTYVGDAGEALALDVRAALGAKMPILMLHERDVAEGACSFARFFEVTPHDLVYALESRTRNLLILRAQPAGHEIMSSLFLLQDEWPLHEPRRCVALGAVPLGLRDDGRAGRGRHAADKRRRDPQQPRSPLRQGHALHGAVAARAARPPQGQLTRCGASRGFCAPYHRDRLQSDARRRCGAAVCAAAQGVRSCSRVQSV